MINIIGDGIFESLLYVIAVYGIVISFRVLNFPDLTIDGSFTLGGAVFAKVLLITENITLATTFCVVSGFLAGILTAFLNRNLKINKILSGILVMLMLYSINLRIMNKALINLTKIENGSLVNLKTMFSYYDSSFAQQIFLFTIVICILISLFVLFKTRLGLTLRGVGDNEAMLKYNGISLSIPVFLGLGLSNSLIAISGALLTQQQGWLDNNLGIGLIITVLAALIIGESILSILNKIIKNRFFLLSKYEVLKYLVAAFVGSIVYFIFKAIVVNLNWMQATDLKLFTAALVIIGISMNRNSQISNHLKERF